MTGFMTVIIGMSGNKLRTPEVTFTSLVPTTITFSWPSVLHATSYEYYTSASGSSPSTLTGDATSKVITVAAGNVPLTFYIRALGDIIYEKSEYGSIQGLSTKGTLPNPVSLSGSSTTTTTVTFNWTAGTPAPFDTNWTYSYYTIINGVTSSTTTGYANTNNSKVITVPNIGDTAEFYLTATGTNYISSATMTATRAAYGYLQAPASITPQAVSTTSIRFTWTNPTSPIVPLSYDYYTVSAGVTSTTSNIPATATTTNKIITVAEAGNATIFVNSVGLPYAPSTTWASIYGTAYLGYGSITPNSIVGVRYSVTEVSFTWTGQNTASYDYYTSLSGSPASPAGTVTDANQPLIVSSGSANTLVTLYLKPTGNSSYMPATSYSSGSGTSYAGIASTSVLSTVEETTTTVRFSWSTESNVASYSYHTNLDTTVRTLPAGTTYKVVNSSGIGGTVTFFLSATGTSNWMDMPEKYLQGSSYGYWATPVLATQPTTSTSFTISWTPVAGATYQYTSPSVTTKTNTTTTSSQSTSVLTAGGNELITIYANGGVYAESSQSITGSAYIGNSSISIPTVSARTPVSVSFVWTGSYISKYEYSFDSATGPWIDNGTTTATKTTTASSTVNIYVKGTANTNYTPPTNVTFSGTAKSGYSSVSGLTGSANGFYAVTFSWTNVHATEVQYYSQYNATVQTTSATTVSVENNIAGGSVIFYVKPLTNDSTNYDTPASYTSVTGYGQSPDTMPSSFSFTSPASAVALNSSNTSNTVTLAGMDDGFLTSVSVSGGTLYYSSQSGSGFSSITSSANISTSNKYIYVTATGSNNYTTSTQVSVNYGGTTASYTVNTIAATPSNDISFTGVTTNSIDTYTASAELILTGFGNSSGNIPVYSSENTTKFIAGSSSGGTTFTMGHTSASPYIAAAAADGKLYLKLSVKSSTLYSTAVTATIYVGTKNGTFTVTTGAMPISTVSVSFTSPGITTARATVSTTGGTPVFYMLYRYTDNTYSTQSTLYYNDGSTPVTSQGGNVFDIGGLPGNTPIYIKAYATNSTSQVYSTGSTFTTLTPVPTGVTLTVSAGVTDVSATLTVAASGGGTPTSYSIERYTDVTYSGTPTVTGPQPSNTFVLTGLNSNTGYYYKGVATTNGGSGRSPGATPTFTTLTAATAPTAPVMGNISTTGAVTWTAPTSTGAAVGGAAATITGYTFTWYSGGTPFTTQAATGTSATLSLPSSNYTETYSVSMTATNSAGLTSSASNVATPGTCGAVSAASPAYTATTFEVNIGNPPSTGGVSTKSYEVRATSGGTVIGSWDYPAGTRQIINLSNFSAGASLTASARRHTAVGATEWVGSVSFGAYPTAATSSFTDSATNYEFSWSVTTTQGTVYYAYVGPAASPSATQPTVWTSAGSGTLNITLTPGAGKGYRCWSYVQSAAGLTSTPVGTLHMAPTLTAPTTPNTVGLATNGLGTFTVDVTLSSTHTGFAYKWKKGIAGTYSALIYATTSASAYTFPAVSTTKGSRVYVVAYSTLAGGALLSSGTTVDNIV
jgi:hypothetical protein